MTVMTMKGKGQMSFDLAFAVVLVLSVFSMVVHFTTTSRDSSEAGRDLMALNMAADYTAGSLNALYASVVSGGKAAYNLTLIDEYLYGPDDSNPYNMDYEVVFGGSTITVRDSNDQNLKVTRKVVSVSCLSGTKQMGEVIELSNCIDSGSSLNCKC